MPVEYEPDYVKRVICAVGLGLAIGFAFIGFIVSVTTVFL